MWKYVCAAWLTCSLVGAGAVARADDQGNAKAIIDRAAKAMGIDAKGAKYKASTFKVKGIYHGMGNPIPYTAEFAIQFPSQSRNMVEADVGGQKFVIGNVVNGDKGWRKVNDDVTEMDKDALAEQKEALYANYVVTLVPLQEPGYTLSPLGDSKVGDHEAVGVKVSHKGYRDVSLFFDKKTGFLIKAEHRVKDDMTQQEMTQETLYSDYKNIDGIQEPAKMTIKRDGNLYIESENSDLKHLENLDASKFDKP